MKPVVMLLAAVVLCGCQRATTETPARTEPAGPNPLLVDRVWASADSTGLPGDMRIFLSDGTLVMDSCWETYQLAQWRMVSDSVVSWQEGTTEIRAAVLELTPQTLALRLDLVAESRIERYTPASVPFLCPDMPR